MNTPIYDFVKNYSELNSVRLHMPGHKGNNFLGVENIDITEINGADSLYDASGIIKESEENASKVFKSGASFYSTEGSSHTIKAMIYAALLKRDKKDGKRPCICAVRNVHKSFIYACGLMDIDVNFIYPKKADGLCGGCATKEEIEKEIINSEPFAVFVTSPNYLGEISDIRGISDVCKKYDIPLLVDNAHGAYLTKFDMHPINLGAAMCVDSAHKTLIALTGGAYLHISNEYNDKYENVIKNAMSVFGSTSPSYLTLASLDLCNKYLTENDFSDTYKKVGELKEYIKGLGFKLVGNEPFKISVKLNGENAEKILRKNDIYCEYYDKSVVVLMFSNENNKNDFSKIKEVFKEIENDGENIKIKIPKGKRVMSIREALMSEYEEIDICDAKGLICKESSVSCPPAIPVAICGEIITDEIVNICQFYGINKISVVKE